LVVNFHLEEYHQKISDHQIGDPMRTIALEEHYATPAFLDGPAREIKERALGLGAGFVLDKLCELGQARVAEMDAAGVDVQVLSLTSPGVEQLEPDEAVVMSRELNDRLAQAVACHPGRLMAFAALPTPAPERAAAELDRAVSELGFVGALVNGHTRGRYLDHPSFSPLFERACALGVPLYLHPTEPPRPVVEAWYGGFSSNVSFALATAAWGWHLETATHVLRLIAGGVFDRFPSLQIVIGHLGEGLASMMRRLDHALPPAMSELERPVSAYLQQNVHYTFAGFDSLPTFLDLLLQVGAARILFSTDHPYASMARGKAFLDQLPVSAADRQAIAHGNAERLLRL
jgi:predicted TIM-barrel fold metal-dependent hydrolase